MCFELTQLSKRGLPNFETRDVEQGIFMFCSQLSGLSLSILSISLGILFQIHNFVFSFHLPKKGQFSIWFWFHGFCSDFGFCPFVFFFFNFCPFFLTFLEQSSFFSILPFCHCLFHSLKLFSLNYHFFSSYLFMFFNILRLGYKL